MTSSFDVFNAANPAFCSVIIHEFIKGYTEASGDGVDFPTLFLPIPIVLSESLNSTFSHTNKKTGFFEWVNRSPEITLELDERLNSTVRITQQAIRFGAQAKLIAISSLGLFYADAKGIKSKSAFGNYKSISGNISRAKRLGYWVGGVQSTGTVFNTLRIAV